MHVTAVFLHRAYGVVRDVGLYRGRVVSQRGQPRHTSCVSMIVTASDTRCPVEPGYQVMRPCSIEHRLNAGAQHRTHPCPWAAARGRVEAERHDTVLAGNEVLVMRPSLEYFEA
jgi:hypothetical protein